MQKFDYTVQAPEGLHARPAGLLAKCAQSCSCEVQISSGGKTANAKRLFGLMGLSVKQNDIVTIRLEGENEVAECEKLRTFCRENI